MNKYFVYELSTGILRAAQSTLRGAQYYMREGHILIMATPTTCEHRFKSIKQVLDNA